MALGADLSINPVSEREAVTVEERFLRINNIFRPCDGDCGVLAQAGVFLDTKLDKVLGLNGFVPPWDYEFSDSGILALSVSRPLVEFGDWVSLEPEVGAALRFGDANSPEVWAAMVVRYQRFPWDRWLDTSVAVAVGASYAFGYDSLEDEQDQDSDLEHLLAYLRPEITFSLPQAPGAELVMGIHHRSGGRDYLLGGLLGSDEGAGAQYLTLGVRWKF